LKRGSPVIGLISGELANASRLSTGGGTPPSSGGLRASASRAQEAHHVFDFQSVEHELGLTKLAALLEITAQ
jgi:hypothetical protein